MSILQDSITDKRVSRRHAILEVVGGQLRIKPIHTNPCFYQSSEKRQLLPLKTNLWHWLNPGDSFSLLVDKYTFHVLSTESEVDMECTLRNSQMLDEDDILNEIPESPVINVPDETGASQLARSTEITKPQTTTTTDSVSFLGQSREFSKQQPNLAERKRFLPAWMLENLNDQNLSAAVISESNVIQGHGKEGNCKDKTQVNIIQQGRKRLISPGSSESTSAEQEAGKKSKNANQEESVISSKEMPQSASSITLSNTEMNNMKTNTQRSEIPIEELDKVSEHKMITTGTPSKDDGVVSCSESCSSAQDKSFWDKTQGSHPESSSDCSKSETLPAKSTDSVLQGCKENQVKRTSCIYGANCYRIPSIFNTSATLVTVIMEVYKSGAKMRLMTGLNVPMEHPVIGFYAVHYSCFYLLRKNPQHKIEYRHSTLPVRNVSEEDNDDVGHPNEYDLNDSFIDDEEEYEPTDEDSEWEPEKEVQEEEDVEELVKEAKKFMKRKNYDFYY
ncbi:aprataxin and PNK-like factor isoform X4 [Nycticebus coucang]|uniref:aprataxin and PNK-like factor isoform X4 n=1 Tax=Nycticebus coucang TaxID=9470 RepID=UPI00234CDC96|nr:aprataxin and PNK-like factor isoform X4 [Nycticebus coucang]